MSNAYQTINRVLLVSDNPEAGYIIHKVLEISDFSKTIVSKTSGISALEYLKKNINFPSTLPEIIILDMSHPVTRGYEFLSTYESDPEIKDTSCKIIVVSNSLNSEQINELLDRPRVVGYVTKPLLVEKLKSLKSSYLKAPDKKQRIN